MWARRWPGYFRSHLRPWSIQGGGRSRKLPQCRRASRPRAGKITDQHWVAIAVAADRVGRPLLRSRRGVMIGIDPTRVEIKVIRIRPRGVVVRVLRRLDPQTARHMQDIGDPNFGAGVTR